MRIVLCTILLFSLVACNSSGDTKAVTITKDSVINAPKHHIELHYIHEFADSNLENKIIEALMKLPFVKKSDAYIDSFSNHKHGMAFMVESLAKGDKEVFVRAGYNGDERFETYYQFYVNPATMEIKVYDVVNDEKMTVKEYIKSQR